MHSLWTSLRGDFCIHSAGTNDINLLKQACTQLVPLMPQKMTRAFICPHHFFQQHEQSINELVHNFHFSKIYTYPAETALDIPRSSMSPEALFFAADPQLNYNAICSFMEASPPPNHLTVNLDAIGANIDAVRAQIGDSTRLLIMVKAHGYGTEEAIISRFLTQKNVDILGVAHVEEALQLRYAGITQSLFIINASELEMEKAILADAEVGLYTEEQIHAAEKAAKTYKKPLLVHLHVDTGMKRFGAHQDNVLILAKLIQKQPHLQLSGIFSHFPASDEPTHDVFSKNQIDHFLKTISTLKEHNINPQYIHIANSAAIFRFTIPECNMVRLGIGLYGYNSSSNTACPELIPSLTLETRISGILHGKKGETVSYGRHYTIPHNTAKIAVIPLGYYDGLHRHHSGKHTVKIRSMEAPIIGAICMDYMMVDITHIPNVQVGDKALLFGIDSDGTHLSPLQFADKGGVILHELLTCLGPRIRRIFTIKSALKKPLQINF